MWRVFAKGIDIMKMCKDAAMAGAVPLRFPRPAKREEVGIGGAKYIFNLHSPPDAKPRIGGHKQCGRTFKTRHTVYGRDP